MIRYVCAVLLITLSAPAFGQIPAAPASRNNEAIRKATEAKELYDSGHYEEALKRFTEADQLYHTLVLVLYEARCQAKLGKLLEAIKAYQRALGERIRPDAPDP